MRPRDLWKRREKTAQWEGRSRRREDLEKGGGRIGIKDEVDLQVTSVFPMRERTTTRTMETITTLESGC